MATRFYGLNTCLSSRTKRVRLPSWSRFIVMPTGVGDDESPTGVGDGSGVRLPKRERFDSERERGERCHQPSTPAGTHMSPCPSAFARLAQLVEATVSKAVQCGFESRGEHARCQRTPSNIERWVAIQRVRFRSPTVEAVV